jgi:hypothetical protein
MEIDQAKAEEQDSDGVQAATPDPSDDETDEEEDSAAPSAREKSSATLRSSSAAQASKKELQTDGNPPPKRELPFGRPATRSKQSQKQLSPPVDEDGDEGTDDEEL